MKPSLLLLLPFFIALQRPLVTETFMSKCTKSFVKLRRNNLLYSVTAVTSIPKEKIVVEVFSTSGCKYCRKAKAKIAELGIRDWVEYNVDDCYNDGLDKLASATRLRLIHAKENTVPQIYVGSHHIGGCDNFIESIEDGTFFQLLEANNISYQNITGTSNISLAQNNYPSLPLLSVGRNFLNNVSDSNSIAGQLSFSDLSKRLQSTSLKLTDKFVSLDGKRVSYKAMRTSPDFDAFVALSEQLRFLSLEELIQLDDRQKIAFFSNIYNSLIIHATCVLGSPADSPSARGDFFSGRSGAKYLIANLPFSPDDIEHGILRANLPHPSSPHALSFFNSSDTLRSSLAIKVENFDPRIHFILNCGASSCPPIKILSSENLEEALSAAAAGYLASEVHVDESEKILRLPKLLFWYGKDFGSNLEEILIKVVKMMRNISSVRATIDSILTKGTLAEYKVEYNPYDWTLNESED